MPDITATRPTAGAPIETAWGQQAHDMLEGIQVGVTDVVCAASNTSKPIVFPRAFTAAPIVVCAIDNSVAAHAVAKVQAGTVTATGFSALVGSATGTSISGTIRYWWMAIGTPA